MNGIAGKIARFLGTRRFYWAVLAFFVIQSLWIALSAKYPMAFDEAFHFDVIKIYAQQWSPFLAGQPEGANEFGALATDPSYLYHYLMSFFYRFIALLTDSQIAQIIFLRIINIAIITFGVILFRKVLLRSGVSQALTNTSILMFSLIPTVPLLAGQINYDTLLVLATAWVCWLVLIITEDLKIRKVDLKIFGLLAISLMLASLVKYAFLPLALVAFIYTIFMVWLTFRGRAFWSPVKTSYVGLSKNIKIGLLALLIASSGLFLQRYGLNIVRYGNPVPPCDAVLSVQSCMEFAPWGRNYRYAAENRYVNPDPIKYTWVWLQALHYRLFFMITGPPGYANYPPVPLPSAAALVVLISGAAALIFYCRRVFFGRPFLVFLLLMSVIYAAVLWSQNYEQFLETSRPVAINGRYLIPLLLPLAAVFGFGLSIALKAWPSAKSWVAVAVIALFLHGGGVFSFIIRSDQAWYWPNQTVVLINQTAQKVLDPIIFEGHK